MNNALVVVIVCACHSTIDMRHAAAQPTSDQSSIEDQQALLESRFYCSITMLKDLYEKILSLDHHFTSLSTHNEVFGLSNPLNYPEFTLVQDYVSADLKSKHSMQMPEFLEQNAIVSGAWTLISLALSDKSADEKSQALESISCLMDFTMRIQDDLNVIYYETDFLREANDELSRKCSELFEEHGVLIGYPLPLHACREKDDWENVFAHISTTFHGLEAQSQYEELNEKVSREMNDLRFRIELTIHFVQDYTSMISHGVQHYQKFEKILTRYEEEESCVDSLPQPFIQLKEDVQLTLEKFENAYQMPELFGSRLKMLMYGVRE